jgi:uncharacterized membrane protein
VIVVVVAMLGIAYPFAVYYMRGSISARSFVLLALCLLALRVFTARSDMARLWRVPLFLMALVLVTTTLLDANLAEKAYPALMSLTGAVTFIWSLFQPPSLIERFARLRRRDLPLAAIAYCRIVTIIWALWFVINAATATGLALWGSLELWTLWTGLLSYLAMGLLIVGEFAVRQWMLRYRFGQ